MLHLGGRENRDGPDEVLARSIAPAYQSHRHLEMNLVAEGGHEVQLQTLEK
jgi:hypothetical protein